MQATRNAGPGSPTLSVAVITLNEAQRIERCLRSVRFADEIVVVDSGSVDGTREIARRLGATVIETPDWPGFGPQKNRALAACRGRWVLSIDADEEVDERLRRAIVEVVQAPEEGEAERESSGRPAADAPSGYWLRRSSSFCGSVIRHGDWGNDRVLRLFRRAHARFTDDLVHERVECPPPHGELAGLLLHDSVDSLEDMVEKTERYARLGADRLRAKGRRAGAAAALVHAGWTFVRGYLLRGGFLDGRPGLTIARLNAKGTWLKYTLPRKE
jgi:glycosyltransferase involved in cell wall biosynthesis